MTDDGRRADAHEAALVWAMTYAQSSHRAIVESPGISAGPTIWLRQIADGIQRHLRKHGKGDYQCSPAKKC